MKKNSIDLLVNFKVALAAVISDENYKSLEVQFLLKKNRRRGGVEYTIIC